MAANKFASMLHRNTNKLTLILIYAVLEWILIILLLLNSLFSYLIIKFADYFGLKRPCLWCSRLDHIFEPQKNKNLYRDLVCDNHATEISKLGYCSNHRKLTESQDMCEDCSSSSHSHGHEMSEFSFFQWVKNIGENRVENGEMNNLRCSCCDVSLNNNKFYSPYVVIKPSWEVLDYTQKKGLIEAGEGDDYIGEGDDNLDRSRSDKVMDRCIDEDGVEEKREEMDNDDDKVADTLMDIHEDDKVGEELEAETVQIKEDEFMKDPSSDETMIQVCSTKDSSLEIFPMNLEFFPDQDNHRLIPVELIDFSSSEDQNGNSHYQETNLDSDLKSETQAELVSENFFSMGEKVAHESKEEVKFALIESMDLEENEDYLIFHAKKEDFFSGEHEQVAFFSGEHEQVAITQTTQALSDKDDDVQAIDEGGRDSNAQPEPEEVYQLGSDETEAKILIETERDDEEQSNVVENREILPAHQDPSTSSDDLVADFDHGTKQPEQEQEQVECKTLSVEINEHVMNKHFSLGSESNENEEERTPRTPNSIEGFHHLHKNFLLEKRESGAEESLDGSVISEFEYGEGGVSTVEKLQSALRAERKALNALYAELEEERSAAAVAANQTMAMINRLQEEKAAMQMEALQYQRMMEEQSEYDQEALQLLNELMVKREKEKQELEKELEVYRKKVMDFEAKEKLMLLKRMREDSTRSGTCSASCSNGEDSDGQSSIDMNFEGKENESFNGIQENGNHNTPVDAVLNLEESLAHFEEERLSILDQLKVLEEKLFTLSDEEERQFIDVKPIEHFYEENGKHLDHNSDFTDGVENGFPMELNGKHHQERRIMIPKAKSLLPLFDDAETEDGELNGQENGFHSVVSENSLLSNSEMDSKKLAIEEEVDHVYERLQALEADREFLRHCFSSLKKGDKGIDLLQEILQHLRDLRNVELRVKNMGDCLLL